MSEVPLYAPPPRQDIESGLVYSEFCVPSERRHYRGTSRIRKCPPPLGSIEIHVRSFRIEPQMATVHSPVGNSPLD